MNDLRNRTTAALLSVMLGAGLVACAGEGATDDPSSADEGDEPVLATTTQALGSSLPNNFPILTQGAFNASYSLQGNVDLDSAFMTPQGTNGRSCGSCHLPQAGWSIRPIDVQLMFVLTGGTDPIFNPLDANNPAADVSTPAARRQAYSMLIEQALFRRGGAVRADAEYEIVAADDPWGYGNTSRFSVFRRSMQTANFRLAANVGWDDGNTVAGNMHQGLFNQARSNITGGQAGATPTNETVESIVAFENDMFNAAILTVRAGRLDGCGAKGGPEALASQAFVAGRFDLYDAWAGSGCGRSPGRDAIARGQEIFNTKTSATGRTCLGCHNAENNGSNVNGVTFNVGASDARFRTPGLPLYTLRHKTTGETVQTTDPGKAFRTGKWADMNRFKSPSLRGLSARAPYFHNGIAKSLDDVVHFYEASLGFDFTPAEERDLVAFMNAL